MMYVRTLDGKGLPLVSVTTFLAAVKWCLKSGETRLLGIYSKEKPTKRTPVTPFVLEAEFENDLT